MNTPAPIDTHSVMFITQRPDVIMVEGKGSWLTDNNGKRYLDFLQGWAVNCQDMAIQE
jgi:acetylornithine/N-succinyldiaminopimelate aminotransferase